MAGEADQVVQLGRRFRRVERDLKLGTFIFFDAKLGDACHPPLGGNHHRAHQPIARSGEASGERTVIIGPQLLTRNFLMIDIPEHNAHLLAFERFVIVPGPIDPKADSVELDRLPRPVNRAIGEKNGRRIRLWLAWRIPLIPP